jgi:hypothetical protein
MFAFCPKTTAELCGVNSSTIEDDPSSLILKANNNLQTISLTGDKRIQYKDGGQTSGRF